MITPKQVFDILKDQHILKSQLSYEELSTTKNFILIKKHFTIPVKTATETIFKSKIQKSSTFLSNKT